MRFLAKHNALEIPFSSSSATLFQNIREFGAEKHFTGHRTANTIKILDAIKGDFSGLFFF